MHPAKRRGTAICFCLLLALAAGPIACGDDTDEEELARASEALKQAREEVDAARRAVDERRERVNTAQLELADAQAVLDGAQEELREAESRVGAKATDAALFRAVQKRLLDDEALEEVAIAADVKDGVVTLSGDVPDAGTRDRALEVAGEVPGIVRVEDRISVPVGGVGAGADL